MNNENINEVAGIDGIFAKCVGAEFGGWINRNYPTASTNGYEPADLIENPAYIIQALLRDEVFVERQLKVDSVSSPDIVVDGSVNGRPLLSSVDDHYNNCYVINHTQATRRTVSDYDGATKTLTLNSTTGFSAGNIISLIDIQGDTKINTTSFDLVGNSTNGKRNGWKFAKSIVDQISVSQIISQLLYESHCILFTSYNQYKLVALDAASSADTWTLSLKARGTEFFDARLTPLNHVFSSFRLRYAYSYAKGDYTKEFYVDKNGYTSGGTVISATEKTLCSNAETNYRVKNNFEYSSDWIYDLTTAEYLLQKLVEWYSKQRLVIKWTTPLHDSNFDYIKYELGDQVKLNNSRIIPTGLNNSSYFMIVGKQIIIQPGNSYIVFKLNEMG